MWKDALRSSDIVPDSFKYFAASTAHFIHRWDGESIEELPGQIVLLGLDAATADPVRTQFFELAWHFGKAQLTDLGNLQADAHEALAIVLSHVRQSGRIILCLGGKPQQWEVAYEVLRQANAYARLAWITGHTPAERPWLDRWLKSTAASVEEGLSLIGVQYHFLSPGRMSVLAEQRLPVVRLSELRRQSALAEPFLRDAHMLLCTLGALKFTETAAACSWPSGLTLEEASLLVQYAALGERMQLACIEGSGQIGAAARCSAVLLWYLIEGLMHRKGDYPRNEAVLQEFVVHVSDQLDLTFFKSRLTGRWWVRHRSGHLVACTESDYRAAASGEMPVRLLQLI